MRNEGLARLYVSRKQLVMAVTYRSSVTLPVWAVSHQPVPLSKPGCAPKPSISLLTCVPPTVFHAFCCLSSGCSPLSFPLISPWQQPLLLFLPSCSYRSKMFAKTSAVTRHSCPPASPLICLSCTDTHSLTFSYKTILGLCPIKAPFDVPWQATRGKWWSISVDESDGMHTEMKWTVRKS